MPQIITAPISESSWQVELEGASYYFTEATEREWEFKTEDYAIGLAGGETKSMRVGGIKKKPITLKKPLQPGDQPLIDWANDKNAPERTLDLVCYDTLGNILYTDRLIGVRPVSISFGKIDLNGTNLTELELELSWQEYQRA